MKEFSLPLPGPRLRVWHLLVSAIMLVCLGLFTSVAHAFAPVDLPDEVIDQAVKNAIGREGSSNSNIFGYAAEELVQTIATKSLGLQCELEANPRHKLRDLVCHDANGRVTGLQVKAGLSPSAAALICQDLAQVRYRSVRLIVTDDAYENVLARCGEAVADYERRGMLERAGFRTERIKSRVEAMRTLGQLPKKGAPTTPHEPLPEKVPVPSGEILTQGGTEVVTASEAAGAATALKIGRGILRRLPLAGAVLGTGWIGWETYRVASDPALNAHEKGERAGGILGKETLQFAAAGGTMWGCGAAAAMLLPAAPVVVPLATGIAATLAVGYALSGSRAEEAVSTSTAKATGWLVDELSNRGARKLAEISPTLTAQPD